MRKKFKLSDYETPVPDLMYVGAKMIFDDYEYRKKLAREAEAKARFMRAVMEGREECGGNENG